MNSIYLTYVIYCAVIVQGFSGRDLTVATASNKGAAQAAMPFIDDDLLWCAETSTDADTKMVDLSQCLVSFNYCLSAPKNNELELK